MSNVRKVCSNPSKRCPNLTKDRLCKECSRAYEHARGSSTQRGYDAFWRRFVTYFRQLLASLGIIPCCGAALPNGPDTKAWSQCAAQGLTTIDRLQLDHEPPLTPDERKNRAAVCNPLRCGFLCESCHARKTAQQNELGGGSQPRNGWGSQTAPVDERTGYGSGSFQG